jgi:glutamyl-tRNA synthetase
MYRGRLAPTPSGYLHVGHAMTFWTAYRRAMEATGELVLRIEDLDRARSRPEFSAAIIEDLGWFGIHWSEGPDVSGPCQPYVQSQRDHFHLHAWNSLMEARAIYPSPHSRRDVELALNAPHEGEAEPIFPPSLRPPRVEPAREPGDVNWRFRVPDGLDIVFRDGRVGEQRFRAGVDFGDFLVWRKDGLPSYELAVVVDDFTMGISEVVRGEDLLLSTARQLLLYRTLGWAAPAFYHCPLVRDASGQRLSKRAGGLSLRELRAQGLEPEEIRERWKTDQR